MVARKTDPIAVGFSCQFCRITILCHFGPCERRRLSIEKQSAVSCCWTLSLVGALGAADPQSGNYFAYAQIPTNY
jgi:hypothetical protein